MSHSLPDELVKKAKDLCRMAHAHELSLAAAESCTGGLLSSLLTDLEGLSHVFERGFVVYSKSSKCELLGIERRLVNDCGAVSRDVAEAMVKGALDRSDADVAIAITGFAGPPGDDGSGGDDKEEGLVHLACQRRGGPLGHREEHFGAIGRDPVRIKAAGVALDMMMAAIDGQKDERDEND